MARGCVRVKVCAYFVQYFRIFRTKNAILGSDCGFRADFSEITHKNRTRPVAGRFTQQKGRLFTKRPVKISVSALFLIIQKRIDLGID